MHSVAHPAPAASDDAAGAALTRVAVAGATGYTGQELLRLMHESEARLSDETTRLQEAQEALDERLAALEKPRGLKAVWRHLIGPRSGQGSRRAKAR